MKTKIVILAAAIAMSHSAGALAQNSTTTINTPAAAAADPSSVSTGSATVNTNTAVADTQVGVKPLIKYLGILHGPGLEFAGSKQAANFGDSYDMEHRPKFGVKINQNLEAGVEARFSTVFANSKVNYQNGSSRLYMNFKNVAKNDYVALSLIPRAVLPTSAGSHQNHMTVSPELIANVDITPKDSRFTFNTGLQVIKHLYTAEGEGKDFANARSLTFDPWAEIDYQVSPKVQATISYWPDWNSSRSNNTLTEAMHEVDVGAYIDIAKGWQLNPYLATDFQGFKAAEADKNMQLNLAVTGTIL